MKFIVDAQLPKSLSDFLAVKGHNSIHTLEIESGNSSKDSGIIDISKKDNRIVITKDSDFLESFLLKGEPSKLILVRTGNIKNVELLTIFSQYFSQIESFIQNNSLIEINKTEIIVHI